MIVAILSTLKYHQDVMKHTVYYAEHCALIAFYDTIKDGTFEAFIAKDEEEAVDFIRKQVAHYLNCCVWGTIDPKDFSFSFKYSQVSNGKFWLIPWSSNCKLYKVQV